MNAVFCKFCQGVGTEGTISNSFYKKVNANGRRWKVVPYSWLEYVSYMGRQKVMSLQSANEILATVYLSSGHECCIHSITYLFS